MEIPPKVFIFKIKFTFLIKLFFSPYFNCLDGSHFKFSVGAQKEDQGDDARDREGEKEDQGDDASDREGEKEDQGDDESDREGENRITIRKMIKEYQIQIFIN